MHGYGKECQQASSFLILGNNVIIVIIAITIAVLVTASVSIGLTVTVTVISILTCCCFVTKVPTEYQTLEEEEREMNCIVS